MRRFRNLVQNLIFFVSYKLKKSKIFAYLANSIVKKFYFSFIHKTWYELSFILCSLLFNFLKKIIISCEELWIRLRLNFFCILRAKNLVCKPFQMDGNESNESWI
jgi:hypothetical protein